MRNEYVRFKADGQDAVRVDDDFGLRHSRACIDFRVALRRHRSGIVDFTDIGETGGATPIWN